MAKMQLAVKELVISTGQKLDDFTTSKTDAGVIIARMQTAANIGAGVMAWAFCSLVISYDSFKAALDACSLACLEACKLAHPSTPTDKFTAKVFNACGDDKALGMDPSTGRPICQRYYQGMRPILAALAALEGNKLFANLIAAMKNLDATVYLAETTLQSIKRIPNLSADDAASLALWIGKNTALAKDGNAFIEAMSDVIDELTKPTAAKKQRAAQLATGEKTEEEDEQEEGEQDTPARGTLLPVQLTKADAKLLLDLACKLHASEDVELRAAIRALADPIRERSLAAAQQAENNKKHPAPVPRKK